MSCRRPRGSAVTAKRLRELAGAGLLERVPYWQPGQRTRHEYRLTDMGRDLLPAALALMAWGDRYLGGAHGGPLSMHHAGCGGRVAVTVACEHGHPVPLEELALRPNWEALR